MKCYFILYFVQTEKFCEKLPDNCTSDPATTATTATTLLPTHPALTLELKLKSERRCGDFEQYEIFHRKYLIVVPAMCESCGDWTGWWCWAWLGLVTLDLSQAQHCSQPAASTSTYRQPPCPPHQPITTSISSFSRSNLLSTTTILLCISYHIIPSFTKHLKSLNLS